MLFRSSTNEVPGFIPHMGNFGLAWRYRSFSVRLAVNYVGTYISSFSAATPARNVYRFSRKITNAGIAYHFRPSMSFTLDVQNLFNEAQRYYRGVHDQINQVRLQGTTLTLSLEGRL